MQNQPQRAARDVSVARVVGQSLRSWSNVRAIGTFAGTVVRRFFWLQFSVKLRLRRVDVVNVDHPLDAAVPFTPARIAAYSDFISFWIRPLGLVGERFGRAAQRRYTNEYLRLITRCYREAAEVYAARMTTTRRPKYRRGGFLVIHLFDPHLLCVPSLHVMVVVLTQAFFRRVWAEMGAPPDGAETLHGELFSGAVAITESVLYIKQHSVNCLPAALYGMSRILPADVTGADVDEFVDALFAGAGAGDVPADAVNVSAEDVTAEDAATADVAAEDAEAIREHIREVFAGLVADGAADPDWMPAVRRFVARFP